MPLAGSVRSAQNVSLGVDANPRRLDRHRIAMEDVGKQRCFDEELVCRRGTQNQRAAVERPPLQAQAPRLDEIDRGNRVALPEKQLTSSERSCFKRLLIECQHGSSDDATGALRAYHDPRRTSAASW